MNIVMLRNEFGSPDGIKIFRFVLGQTYDIDIWPMSRELARSFIQAKAAEYVREQQGPTENKTDESLVAEKPKKEEQTEDLPVVHQKRATKERQ